MTFLLDVNVWLALAVFDHAHHRTAAAWLEGITEPNTVLFCRSTQQAFLRLLTTAAVMASFGGQPLSNRAAWSAYEAMLDDDRVRLLTKEPAGLASSWRGLTDRATASPKLWMDAYLAAFALAVGARMVTIDAAFRQFHGLDLLVLGEPS